MIKANELRTGNVVGVYTGDQYAKYKDIIDSNDLTECACAEYYPIPLTPEILEKCGFEMPSATKDIDKHFFITNYEGMRLQIEKDDEGHYVVESLSLPHISSLHQLQNLYFALTGTELTITL